MEIISPVRARAQAENDLMAIDQSNRRNALLDAQMRREDQRFTFDQQRHDAELQRAQQEREAAAEAESVGWIKNAIGYARQNPQAIPALMRQAKQRGLVPAEIPDALSPQELDQLAMHYGVEAPNQPELPADVRAAQYFAEHPELAAVDRQQRAASAPTVNFKQEGAEAAAVGKGYGEQYVELQKAGVAADGKIARYDRMGSLLDGVKTGKLTPTTTQIAALAASLGVNVDPALGAKQAADALSNEIALQLRNPSGGAGMPGALSDKDREFLMSMTPGLGKTPEGNRLIIETAKKLAQREKDVAKLAREYRIKNKTLDDGFYVVLEQYSAANPLFDRMKAPAPAQSGPTVSNW